MRSKEQSAMSLTNTTPSPDFKARTDLTWFIRERARETVKEVGFGWVGSQSAPSTYQQLRGAFAHSESTGAPLVVSDQNCDSAIYAMPQDNVAFRFWHDVHHVKLGLSFRLEDELELAIWHLDQAVLGGFMPNSLPYQLLKADLFGQVLLMALIGRFPFDQAEFVTTCAEAGLLNGLLDEIRRIP
jgi:hypothetical protein